MYIAKRNRQALAVNISVASAVPNVVSTSATIPSKNINTPRQAAHDERNFTLHLPPIATKYRYVASEIRHCPANNP